MFGYIKPYKPEMKFKEFDIYKSIYCGFCKLLGKNYGSIYKLTLSYDFTFVALLSKSTQQEEPCVTKCSCPTHPFSKRKCTNLSDNSMLSSAAIMLLVLKLEDDISDSRFFKRTFYKTLSLLTKGAYKKSKRLYPELYEAFSQTIKTQNQLEKQTNLTIDAYSQPTGDSLAYLFSCLSQDSTQKRVLERLGLLIGRYVYQVDALDDLSSDIKSGSFNPYKPLIDNSSAKATQSVKQDISMSINLLIGEIINTYELLEIKRYKEVLDNIIYFGLQNTVMTICSRNKDRMEFTNEESV